MKSVLDTESITLDRDESVKLCDWNFNLFCQSLPHFTGICCILKEVMQNGFKL